MGNMPRVLQSPDASARDGILAGAPYILEDHRKNENLLPIIRDQLKTAIRNNRFIDHYFSRQSVDVDKIGRLEDVPYIPVQMFKHFDLRTCPEGEVAKILQSSGTTGGSPSRIPLDKSTTLNQIKALKSILEDYLGKNRKIFLVIDHEGINKPEMAFSARNRRSPGPEHLCEKNVLPAQGRKRNIDPEHASDPGSHRKLCARGRVCVRVHLYHLDSLL